MGVLQCVSSILQCHCNCWLHPIQVIKTMSLLSIQSFNLLCFLTLPSAAFYFQLHIHSPQTDNIPPQGLMPWKMTIWRVKFRIGFSPTASDHCIHPSPRCFSDLCVDNGMQQLWKGCVCVSQALRDWFCCLCVRWLTGLYLPSHTSTVLWHNTIFEREKYHTFPSWTFDKRIIFAVSGKAEMFIELWTGGVVLKG